MRPSPSSASVEPPSGTWKLWVKLESEPAPPCTPISLNTKIDDCGAKKPLTVGAPLSADSVVSIVPEQIPNTHCPLQTLSLTLAPKPLTLRSTPKMLALPSSVETLKKK